MTLYEPQRKAANLQAMAKEAINLAIHGRWEEAVDLNREIIDLTPGDVNSFNRLGKALMQLGRYEEAREAFNQGLEIAPNNTIAKKNIQKISLLMEAGKSRQGTQSRRAVYQFIEETGKTGVVNLVRPGLPAILAHLSAGEAVTLKVEGKSLKVEAEHGDYIGGIEPRLALRLVELIQGGNRYEGAITSAREDGVTVILREVHQDPGMVGRISFPSRSADDFRSYIKESVIRRETGREKETYHEAETEPIEDDKEMPEGMSIIEGGRG